MSQTAKSTKMEQTGRADDTKGSWGGEQTSGQGCAVQGRSLRAATTTRGFIPRQRPQRGRPSDHVHSLKTPESAPGGRPGEAGRAGSECTASLHPRAICARTVTPQGQPRGAQHPRPRLSQPAGQEPHSPRASESEENRAWTVAPRAQQPSPQNKPYSSWVADTPDRNPTSWGCGFLERLKLRCRGCRES